MIWTDQLFLLLFLATSQIPETFSDALGAALSFLFQEQGFISDAPYPSTKSLNDNIAFIVY